MPAPRRKMTLADLSDDDRRELLEEAREAAKTNPTDVEGYAELSDREKAIRSLMDARDHMRGCPVQEGRELGRIEGYDSRKPPNPAIGEPERFIAVVRCIECGGTTAFTRPPQTLDEVLAGIDKPELEAAVAGASSDGDTP